MIVRSVRTVLAAVALVSVSAFSLQAQQSNGLGLSAGFALPTGDLSDAEAGLGFQIGGEYLKTLQGPLSLRFNVDYTRFGIDASGVNGSYSNLAGMANLVYNINTTSSFHPYLIGGLGFGNFTADIDGFGAQTESGLGFNVGAGYHFEMSGKKWFTELRFVSQDAGGDPITYVPIVLGFRF